MIGGSTCMYSSRSLQICPLLNRTHSGKSVLIETNIEVRAGAPFHRAALRERRGARCGCGPGAPAPPQSDRRTRRLVLEARSFRAIQ